MAEANINAYYAEVAEAEKALIIARSNYETAVERLEAKKQELGIVEEVVQEVEEVVETSEENKGITSDPVVTTPDEEVEPTDTTPEEPTTDEVQHES